MTTTPTITTDETGLTTVTLHCGCTYARGAYTTVCDEHTPKTHQVSGTAALLSLPCGCLTYGSKVTEFCPDHEPVLCGCDCGTPVTDETGSDWCGRWGSTIHPDHHGHWGDCS